MFLHACLHFALIKKKGNLHEHLIYMNVSDEGAAPAAPEFYCHVGRQQDTVSKTILIINWSRIDLLGLSARDKPPVMHHASFIGAMWMQIYRVTCGIFN